MSTVSFPRRVVRRLRRMRSELGARRLARRQARARAIPPDLAAARALRTGAIDGMPAEELRRLAGDLHERGHLALSIEVQKRVVAASTRDSDRVRLARLEGLARFLRGDDLPTVAAEPLEPASPDRVLHVVKSGYPETIAGYTLRTHRTAVAQREAGWDVHVVTHTGRYDDGAPPTGVVDGIRYHRLAGPGTKEVPHDAWFDAHVTALAALVRQLRPAVLHAASDFVNARAARLVATAFGIPVVYEVRGFWEETLRSSLTARFGWSPRREPDTYRWRRAAEAREYRLADAVVTLAPPMVERIASTGADPGAITLVPNAIDPDEFSPVPRDRGLLADLGFRADTTVIGYISTLNEYEGIDTLIRAFARLRVGGRAGGLGLLIVGDGPDRARLEGIAREVGRTGIVFTGQLPPADVGRYYGIIDVFVVPRTDAEVCRLVTPLKPYEAMAHGRALVMSDVAALAGIVRESGTGRLARPGDVRDLARVLRRTLSDDAERFASAERGRRWVVSERTWAANAAAYRGVYAAAARRRRETAGPRG